MRAERHGSAHGSPLQAAAPAGRTVAGAHYDRIARWYGVLVDPFERRPRDVALRLLAARPGEWVLEIGSGTGRAIVEIAQAVGPVGHVSGVDASRAMCGIAERRARDAGVSGHVELTVGDAVRLPYPDACFDAVFTCFTIDVLGEARGSEVLRECRRVLRPRGRVVAVSLSDRGGRSVAAGLYRRARALLPDLVDCTPIALPAMLRAADLAVSKELHLTLYGLPVDVVCAFRRVERPVWRHARDRPTRTGRGRDRQPSDRPEGCPEEERGSPAPQTK